MFSRRYEFSKWFLLMLVTGAGITSQLWRGSRSPWMTGAMATMLGCPIGFFFTAAVGIHSDNNSVKITLPVAFKIINSVLIFSFYICSCTETERLCWFRHLTAGFLPYVYCKRLLPGNNIPKPKHILLLCKLSATCLWNKSCHHS